MLVALSVLEGLFYADCGMKSVSLSFAQGTDPDQDAGAILALKRLAAEYLQPGLHPHLVLYTWMGLFPRTEGGARALLVDSARLAVTAGVQRLIVKTTVEAFHIPTIADNEQALRCARAAAAERSMMSTAAVGHAQETYADAKRIIDTALSLGSTIDLVLERGFHSGVLDVPFCLHPDNRNLARAAVDAKTGTIRWAAAGHVPVRAAPGRRAARSSSAADLLASLQFNRDRYDRVAHAPQTGAALRTALR
jgi:methylaspartate mutase epsilon subunit